MEFESMEHIIFTEDEIALRVGELGKEITADYIREHGSEVEVLAVSILKGGFIFLADLIRHIDLNLTMDFVAISSYHQSNQASSNVRIIKEDRKSVV